MLSTRSSCLAIPSLLLAYGCSTETIVHHSHGSGSPDDQSTGAEVGTGPGNSGDQGTGPTDDGNGPGVQAANPGYTITGGALFQGVKLPIFGDGVKEGAAVPVVVSRPGVVRIYKHVIDKKLDQQTRVTFRYRDAAGAVQTIKVAKSITRDSIETDPSSVVDVALPAEAFHDALEYQLEVRNGKDEIIDNYPEDSTAFAPLHADNRTKSVHVVVVPVKYGSSARLPDTSPDQLALLADEMRALYPVSEVDVSVRSKTFAWNQAVDADGTGWDDLLYGLLEERQRDGVSDDTYYYGAFSPSSSFEQFCQQGCVAGLSPVSATVHDASDRGSIGLGFSGDTAAETFAHEIGHAHGRQHSPCGGAAAPDPHYPYSEASIGVPGWDVRDGTFVQVGSGRESYTDFMGYCPNTWVSDYTWKALFTRITGLEATLHTAAALTPVDYRVLRVNPASPTPARFIGRLTVRGKASDETVHATLANGAGIELAQIALDHLPGHVLYVPASLSGQTLRIDGVQLPVTVP